MSEYEALARKYRPRIFRDLVGQESLVTTISNAISSNRIHHAFVLTGTRGVGKTTSARIIATNLNCLNSESPTIEPCLKCTNCVQIIAGSHPDVIEFDAASKTGVDVMREMIESCSYPPMAARYKIYIIDEVHMLSKAAFNALLKTLEEPLSNIKFIFATTEINKVPITILSRCQKFNLRSLDAVEIGAHLRNICIKELISYDEKSIDLLAKMAAGSVRDALSLLDQAIAQSGNRKSINYEETKKVFALTDIDEIVKMLISVIKGDVVEADAVLSVIMQNNGDVMYVLEAMCSICLDAVKAISLGQNLEAKMGELLQASSTPVLLRMYQMIIKSFEEIKIVRDKNLVLQMLLMRLIYCASLPTPAESIKQIQDQAVKRGSVHDGLS